MKKIFWMMAVALVAGLSFTSCGSDDDDNANANPSNPGTNPPTNTKFNVYASVVLDKNLAEYGYVVATYTYKDKSETIELKKGDTSDGFPSANNFASTVMNYLNQKTGIAYATDDLIIRNVIITDLDKSKDENAVFKIKFVIDPEHPQLTEESNRTFIVPDVLGYTDGGLTMVRSDFRIGQGIRVSKFEEWLNKRTEEVTITFGPGASNE